MFLVGILMSFVACTGCGNKEIVKPQDSTIIDSVATLNVEHVIATDRQDMYMNYAKDYRWFETCIVLNNFLDEECDGSIAGISNVFQAVVEKDKGADVFVVMYTHTADTSAVQKVHSFWIEDLPMENEAIKITFKEAFDKVMATNAPKPHSQHVVLRKQLGPVNCNPQYIFGNNKAQLYVDAVTGDVKTDNPVFPEEKGFKMPLGEWP